MYKREDWKRELAICFSVSFIFGLLVFFSCLFYGWLFLGEVGLASKIGLVGGSVIFFSLFITTVYFSFKSYNY